MKKIDKKTLLPMLLLICSIGIIGLILSIPDPLSKIMSIGILLTVSLSSGIATYVVFNTPKFSRTNDKHIGK